MSLKHLEQSLAGLRGTLGAVQTELHLMQDATTSETKVPSLHTLER